MKLPPGLLRDHPLVSFRAFGAFKPSHSVPPAGEVSEPKCLVTRESQSLNARNDVAKFDVFSCLRLSFEELHYAVRHFLAKSNAIGQPDQICVLKLDSRALVTIVKQGLQSGTLQVAI